MIKVMIIDDEPYIRQGLKILINWEQYGFEICAEAANGKEAVNLMENNEFDLIITDIKMPQMDGLELIEYTRAHISNNIRFIILSGFYEFEYAKKAIKYDVADYVLKPIKEEELIKVLEEYKVLYSKQVENERKIEYSEKIILDQYLTSLLTRNDKEEYITYIRKYLKEITDVRYIGIEIDNTQYDLLTKEERRKIREKLYDALKDYLGDQWYHAYMPNGIENEYAVGFIYVKALAIHVDMSEKEYVDNLYRALCSALGSKIIFYIGQKVNHIGHLSESYKSAVIAKNFQMFSDFNQIAYYEDVKEKTSKSKYLLDKEKLNSLIRAIEENDKDSINQKVDIVYEYFKELITEPDIIKINLDYLLVHLINLANELDPDLDREVLQMMISLKDYEQIAVRGSVNSFKKFSVDFADFLSSLRRHTLGGILSDVVKEVTENYMENLSLKSLSKKFFINSAYLGQIFKKQFGCSFKDYLNNYRIERATEQLIRSEEKIYEIATAVGFNNTDYFISKFVQIRGTTPLQYRKQCINK